MFNNTFTLTTLALIAFAANSVFCRLALGDQQIDAGSFTVIRLLSGALFLAFFIAIQQYSQKKAQQQYSQKKTQQQVSHEAAHQKSKGSWLNATWLFVYALTFSYAYIQLDTATGALVLFATVQVTMLFARLIQGHRLSRAELLGLILAIAGFVYLLAPQVSSPSLIAFVLMCLSGICWAFYTLAGKKSNNPSADTAFNFIRTIPFLLIFALINIDTSELTQVGVLYAILSGVLASALGYLLWYQALTKLRHNVAAVVQLLVPVLAAVAGFIFLGESVSLVFVTSSLMILSGILLVIKNPRLSFRRTTKQ